MSEGAIHVRNPLLEYPNELRERILVVAIAPGAYIYSETCARVIHYRARDLVPWLDFYGLIRERHSTVILPSAPDASWIDHSFMSPTYIYSIRKHMDKYLISGGKEI